LLTGMACLLVGDLELRWLIDRCGWMNAGGTWIWESPTSKDNPRVVSRSAQLGKSLIYDPERKVDQCASTDLP